MSSRAAIWAAANGGALGPLGLSGPDLAVGVLATFAITGATTGSVITASGLPGGWTLNSAARTLSGTPVAGLKAAVFLTETLTGKANSPKQNAFDIELKSASVSYDPDAADAARFAVPADRWAGSRGTYTPATGLESAGISANGATDRSAALTSLFASASLQRPLRVGQLYNILTATGAIRVGGATIPIPAHSGMMGEGISSKFVIPVAPSAGVPVFGINTLGDGRWIRSFPGRSGSIYDSLYFDASIAATSGITLFELAASGKFSNLLTNGIERLFKQADGIKMGETSTPYVDMVTVDHVTAKQPAGSLYYVDGFGTGDGWDINQLHMALNWSSYVNGVGVDSTAIRPRAVRLAYKNGLTIRNPLNGDHLFVGCDAVNVMGGHMETGSFEFQSSSGLVMGTSIWKHHENTGDLAVVPLRVSNQAGVGGSSPGVMAYSRINVIHQQGFLTYGYSKVLADLSVPSTYRGILEINDVYRRHRGRSPSLGICLGISTAGAWPEFDSYSHIASKGSRFEHSEWHICGDFVSLPSNPGGLSVPLSGPSADLGVWEAPTGTYYFKVALCIDSERAVGVLGTNEVTASMTLGGPSLNLTLETAFTGMVLIGMGAVSNSYDRIFRVPMIAGTVIPCNGLDIDGYTPSARVAGAMTPLNSGSPLGGSVCPGESASLNSSSTAYGHAEFSLRYNDTTSIGAFPLRGAWRRGDVIRWPTPQLGGAFQGYRRLIDGSSHTLFTPDITPTGDWEPIVIGTPEATAAELGQAAHAVNAILRKRGRVVLNSTSGKLMVKTGSTAGSAWSQVDTPTTIITPA